MTNLEKYLSLLTEEVDGLLLTSRYSRHYAAQFDIAEGVAIVTAKGCRYFTDSRYTESAQNNIKNFEVIDLEVDVPPEVFIQTAMEEECDLICCSALLTTTMDVMADVVKAAEAAGIRDQVKIMVGGAPINQEFCAAIGADCYTVDAASAADAAVDLCNQLAK